MDTAEVLRQSKTLIEQRVLDTAFRRVAICLAFPIMFFYGDIAPLPAVFGLVGIVALVFVLRRLMAAMPARLAKLPPWLRRPVL